MINLQAPLLTVSRLVDLLREVVEENFLEVRVEGEVSNFSAPASGHFYFTLKDARSQLRAVMFRGHNRLLDFRPENGMAVVCAGRLSVYPQRGELQLVAESLEPQGRGELQRAFEQLKTKLAAEGLFAEELKRPLPSFPETIGVVTSATGAAFQDILQVLRRRGAGVRVVLRPVRVQGEGAAEEIAAAIADLDRHGRADVLLVGRGGGSLEDLWAFNEEVVARAIRASTIPVISAVGHEVDVTIADFAADLRAPTPSAAAELVAKSRLEMESHLDHLMLRLGGQMRSRLRFWQEQVEGRLRRLRSPLEILHWQQRRVTELEGRLLRALELSRQRARERLERFRERLEGLSPLAVLARGYAVVQDPRSGRAVRSAAEILQGDRVEIRLHRGRAGARIEEVQE